MRVLVYGGRGFIGTHLRAYLKANRPDWEVGVLPEPGRYDAVINLAASADPAWCAEHPVETVTNAAEIMHDLEGLDWGHLIHVSTVEALGPCYTPTGHREDAPLGPCSPYAIGKGVQESMANLMHAKGRPVTIVRTANVFGEHQPKTKFIPTIVKNVCNDQVVYITGNPARTWIHADQLAAGLVRLVSRDWWPDRPVVHITGNLSCTNKDLAEIVGQIAVGKDPQLGTKDPTHPGHLNSYILEPSPNFTPIDPTWVHLARTVGALARDYGD